MWCRADHPLEAYYRTLLESLKDLAKELRLVQATGNSLFAVSRIGSQVRSLSIGADYAYTMDESMPPAGASSHSTYTLWSIIRAEV